MLKRSSYFAAVANCRNVESYTALLAVSRCHLFLRNHSPHLGLVRRLLRIMEIYFQEEIP